MRLRPRRAGDAVCIVRFLAASSKSENAGRSRTDVWSTSVGGASAHGLRRARWPGATSGRAASWQNIVTGGGKTALIAATMVWLRPRVRGPTLAQPLPELDRARPAPGRLPSSGKVFLDRGLIPPGGAISGDDFALTTLGGVRQERSRGAAASRRACRARQTSTSSTRAGPGARRTSTAFSRPTTRPSPYGPTPSAQDTRSCSRLRPNAPRASRSRGLPLPAGYDSDPRPRRRQSGRQPHDLRVRHPRRPSATKVIATPLSISRIVETVELTYTDTETGDPAPSRGDRLGGG